MRKTLAILCLSVALASAVAHGDLPVPEREYSVVSPGGHYRFTMYPAGTDGDAVREQHGEARKVGQDDDSPPLWTVTGWYSFETYIADDGRSLVRVGPWAARPPASELAIAFYRDGEEVRSYTVADLVEDTDSLPRTSSHYTWQSRDNDVPVLTQGGEFRLRSLEGRLFTFDVTTGELLPVDPGEEAIASPMAKHVPTTEQGAGVRMTESRRARKQADMTRTRIAGETR